MSDRLAEAISTSGRSVYVQDRGISPFSAERGRGTLTLVAHNGRDLKAERVRVGLTQAQLARRLGVSQQRVSAVENMIRPSGTFARRYLEAIGAGDGGLR